MASRSVPDFLTADVEVLLFGGKGGVGKTTCAAATALRRSQREDVLLLSTDPAHSLRDSLASNDRLPRRLSVEEFDAASALADFRQAHGETLQGIVERGTLLDDEDVTQLLDLSLPGMDEVMAFLRLADLLVDSDAPCVIVDTAPTGHTLRLLDTPDQFLRWVGFLDTLLEKHRTMRSVFGRQSGPDAFDAFLDDLRSRADRVLDVLRDPTRCRFVLVTRAEPLVLSETASLFDDLHAQGVPASECVVNAWPPSGDPARPAHRSALHAHADTVERWTTWLVPAQGDEVRGPDALAAFWDDATRLDLRDLSDADAPDDRPFPPVVAPLAPLDAPLLLVGGKGGVGKTTVACATALARAHALADQASAGDDDRRILLVSTDPAHSISGALRTDVGTEPTPVADRLDAVEVDAAGRFATLREQYADAVGRFFEQTGGPNVDVTYDRRVMQGLMNLAPPGIDEVMGWIAAMEFLREDRYASCVVDSAPTGHFVRLLETPSLFREWLRTFFRILRKHRNVVHLPDLNDRLVRLSKQTRRFLDAVDDGDAVVLGVALPSEMALAETTDLAAATERLTIRLPALVVNRLPDDATPWLDRFRNALPGTAIAGIRDGRPPLGVDALSALGSRLWRSDV